MLNFICCDSNKESLITNSIIINKVMFYSNIEYKISSFSDYNIDLKKAINGDGPKIYILALDIPKKCGLDIIREIRKKDFYSQIIVSSTHYELVDKVYRSKLMVMDFISRLDNHDATLEEDINLALESFGKRNLIINNNRNIYEYIDINDILFIKKEKSKNKCYIKTINSSITINDSLVNLEKKLTNLFCKTHRSCIVNIKYITKVDYKKQVIYFNNNDILHNLIAQSKYKKLKRALSKS